MYKRTIKTAHAYRPAAKPAAAPTKMKKTVMTKIMPKPGNRAKRRMYA